MKDEIITIGAQYADPAHEESIRGMKSRLLATVELQGRQDGTQNRPRNISEHQTLILNLIEVTVQSAIDFNQRVYLPVSGVLGAKFVKEEAEKKAKELQKEINDDEHALQSVINEANGLNPDVKLIQMRKFVFASLGFVALTEGYLSYSAFRYASFTIVASVLVSITIAFAVGIVAHLSGGYIKTAETRTQLIGRYIFALLPAISGFIALGVMRANAYNHIPNLQVGSQYVTSHLQGSVSATSIAIVSILLYWVALFLSSHFFRTKGERQREYQYEQKCNTISRLQKMIQEKTDEIDKVQSYKLAQMNLAHRRFEYAGYQEYHLCNFAQEASEAYKRTNLRYRDNECPSFYSQKPLFCFITFFDKLNSKSNETA